MQICNRKWQPTPVLLPEKSHGQRSLVGEVTLLLMDHLQDDSLSSDAFQSLLGSMHVSVCVHVSEVRTSVLSSY